MNAYNEPSKSVVIEEKIKRSIFIASLKKCCNEIETREFLNSILSSHRDATHNCRAFIIGAEDVKNFIEYSSDDGEPSGTAGKPILAAIKHSEIINVMIIVTRYFGGVKLGTRGLIDAYGDVAKKALQECEPVKKFFTRNFKITFEYNLFSAVNKIFETHHAINIRPEFSQEIFFDADVPVNECDSLKIKLDELNLRGLLKYV